MLLKFKNKIQKLEIKNIEIYHIPISEINKIYKLIFMNLYKYFKDTILIIIKFLKANLL